MTDLFRSEALDHQRQRFHGAIVLTRTWSYPVLTAFFCVLVAALTVFAALAGFTRKEVVSGIVVSDQGVIRVLAPRSGVVGAAHVAEGQVVKVGDSLFTLTSEPSNAAGVSRRNIERSLAARLERIDTELAQLRMQQSLKRTELASRKDSLQASLVQHESALAVQRRKLQLARDTAERTQGLAAAGMVSQVAANARSGEAIDEESRVEALQRVRLEVQRELLAVQAQIVDLPHQAARDASRLQREAEELRQALDEQALQGELVIRAERDGTVVGLVAGQGEAVTAGARLASLLPPQGRVLAELYVPSRAIAFVQPGTPVVLRYDALPYQKFGSFPGQVVEVSAVALPLAELRTAAPLEVGVLPAAESAYRVRVKPVASEVGMADRHLAIRPGMQVSASLVLERRSLLEWAIEPLLALRRGA